MQPIIESVRRSSFEDVNCSVAQFLEVAGDWWTMLIVRDAFFGVTRFSDFQRRLGVARNILADRLDWLVSHGVFSQREYQPGRSDYVLTDKGRDLWLVLTAMRQWGDRWHAEAGPPVEMIHKGCGHVAQAVVVCSACGEALDGRDVRVQLGPGATDDSLLPL